jgi:hypothetical protein
MACAAVESPTTFFIPSPIGVTPIGGVSAYGELLLQRLGHFWEHKLFCDLTLRVENASYQVIFKRSFFL